MSDNEKEWLRAALEALRSGKDMSQFQHSSFLSSILLGLKREDKS